MAEQNAPIRVGLLGAGTVGSQTARILVEQKDELGQRIGRPLEISGIACLDPNEVDFPWIDKSLLTSDTMSVVKNADIVVELIGGTGVARTFVLEALNNGASVVTANKALLAKYGPELYKAAEDNHADIYFEAAVGGAIPIVRPLRESLVGDQVKSMLGIVNGTTNYILDEMTTKGLDFRRRTQGGPGRRAMPEADRPVTSKATMPRQGAIMATLGFHTNVGIDDVTRGRHHAHHRRRHCRRHRGRQGGEAARRGRSHRRRRLRTRLPCAHSQRAPAGVGAWLLQRGLPARRVCR